ncbi:MAG: GTPase, partial [Allorhizobium sp.]
DFSKPANGPAGIGGADFASSDPEPFDLDFAVANAPEPVDLESERRAAYAEGYEAAERALQEKFETERQSLVEAHARELDDLRQKFEAEAMQTIAGGMQKLASEIAYAVSDQTAVAIAPLLSEQIAAKAVSDLADLLRTAILSGEAATVTVQGPRGLFDALVGNMPEVAGSLRHVEAEDLDLSVDIGETVLVTRISAWTASLKKVLG